MAYCPLAQAGKLRTGLMHHEAVQGIAAELGASAAQVLLAWVIREPGGGWLSRRHPAWRM
ncbi:hypothetical protein NVIRENTERO_00604 [Sodalis praecaptivus]|nr:hypothetical protein NVIRENTERO_00604 [Sodalis praecaptivus]